MQIARGPRPPTLAEVALDALAADLTVPHARPLVDLERDDYADLALCEPRTARFTRPEEPATSPFEPVTVRFTRPYERIEIREVPTAPRALRWTNTTIVALALLTVAMGFGLGAGIAWILV